MTPRLKPGAFHLTRGCEWAGLRRIYCEAPKSGEIPGCVEIGESGVATVQTAKLGLTLAVGLFAVATLAAGATRVPRIDHDDPHALNLGFVLDEGPQLEEAPAALSIALRPPNRGPRANTLQVFQGNPARRVLGGRNDLLADAMILDATKPAFAARQGLQSFPRTSRAGLLQGGAIPLMAVGGCVRPSRRCRSCRHYRWRGSRSRGRRREIQSSESACRLARQPSRAETTCRPCAARGRTDLDPFRWTVK